MLFSGFPFLAYVIYVSMTVICMFNVSLKLTDSVPWFSTHLTFTVFGIFCLQLFSQCDNSHRHFTQTFKAHAEVKM